MLVGVVDEVRKDLGLGLGRGHGGLLVPPGGPWPCRDASRKLYSA
jgi:hypothetical protein